MSWCNIHICRITAVNQKNTSQHHLNMWSPLMCQKTVDKQTQTENYGIEIKAQMLGRPGRSPWHATPCQRPLGLAAASPPASAPLVAALLPPLHLGPTGITGWAGREHWLARWWCSLLAGSPQSPCPAALALPPTPGLGSLQPLSIIIITSNLQWSQGSL